MRNHAKNYNRKMKRSKKDVLQDELNNVVGKNNLKSIGDITRSLLKRKGIVSPNTSDKIKIVEGFYIKPKKIFKNDKEKKIWIDQMIEKYDLNKYQ